VNLEKEKYTRIALIGSATTLLIGCGLSPSEPPKFDDAIQCATINALAGQDEPDSEETKLVEIWLAYAARQPGQSEESVSKRFDEEWAALENKIVNMSDAETMSFSIENSMKCVGFEEDYKSELQSGS